MAKSLSLFHSAFWNVLTIFITALAGFILVPLIIKSIGSESFGIYTIILMIGGFAELQSLGLGEATLKYVAQYHSKNDIVGINRVLGATLSVYSFSAIVISGLIVTFAGNITTLFNVSPINILTTTEAIRIAGFAFFLNAFNGALKAIPEATQRYDILNKYTLIMLVLKYTAMYTIVKLGIGIVGLTYLVLVCAFIDIVVYSFLAKFLVKGIKCIPNFSKQGIKEVFSYGVFSFINDLIQKASLYIDQFILGVFFSASAVAYLTAPKDLVSKAQGLTGAVGRALFPRFSSMDEDENMHKLYTTSLWILTVLSIVVFVPLAIIIPSFLVKWIGPAFAKESSDFAVLFSLGIALNGGVSAYTSLLKGTGRIKWLTNIITSLTVFSGVVTAILVYKFGIIGSGIRVILFSWVGIALCLYIGKKIFQTFAVVKVAIQSAIIPILIGGSYFLLGKFVFKKIILDNWLTIPFSYIILILFLLFLQISANLIFYQKQGEAYHLIKRIAIRRSKNYE